MPFRSEAQRRYLWSTHPDIARRWANETRGGGKTMKKTLKFPADGKTMKKKLKKKNWIAGAIKHPGALRRTAGVKKGGKIPSGKLNQLAQRGGKTGQRARLAETLRSFHKRKKTKKQ